MFHRLLEPAVNALWYVALVMIWLVILADEICSEGLVVSDTTDRAPAC